mmetsp:Transcript_22473/g.34279  ORF Transcript_22473/g.34279 Transcript_22473/m.34279 type:complete len:294 (+) Transcript_22473:160-1041(+)
MCKYRISTSSLCLIWSATQMNWASAFLLSPSSIAFNSPATMKRITPTYMVDPDLFQTGSFVQTVEIVENFLQSSSIMQAVETFDGSTIVDPVVVSNVFWSRLQTNIISVIIGQVLAAIAFSGLTYIFSSQISKAGNYISENMFNEAAVSKNVDVIANSIKEKSQSPTYAPDFGKLLLCLIIDIVGTSSELIPFFGDLTDIAYAPVAALALRSMFNGSNVIFALEFLEEILPITDILPLATICWVVETFYGESNIARTLQIGIYNKNKMGNGAIDIDAKTEDRLLNIKEDSNKR